MTSRKPRTKRGAAKKTPTSTIRLRSETHERVKVLGSVLGVSTHDELLTKVIDQYMAHKLTPTERKNVRMLVKMHQNKEKNKQKKAKEMNT